jgi:4-amino-4-deoxy-L-arabinose transferase-like glycosyltransferase
MNTPSYQKSQPKSNHSISRFKLWFETSRPITLPTTWCWLPLALSLALLSAVVLPLNLLTIQRFHHDEARYATWALEIASGNNPWLAEIPIDKPPLFFYAVAGTMSLLGATETAARLPSILATVCIVGLTFGLGRKLYNSGVALLAAWLVALSPFTILFAPTAFTDPMLVAWVLAGCLAAAYGRGGWAGVLLGLAIGTKQQGVLFVPLVIGLVVIGRQPPVAGDRRSASRSALFALARFLLTLLVTLIPLFLWDSTRHQSPGFWQLSLANYGGLTTNLSGFSERWRGFIELLRYGTASSTLNAIFIVGLPLLLIYDVWRVLKQRTNKTSQPANQQTTTPSTDFTGQASYPHQYRYDWLFSLFILALLVGHAWFSFQIWDRYLLGLIPFLALLLARILLLPWSILQDFWLHRHPDLLLFSRWILIIILIVLIAVTLTPPVQDAVNARYPLGSNSKALQGIEQVVAYLQGHAGANNTLYHRWLGTHWRFYLWDYPYDLQYWESPRALADKARPGHLIAVPTWQSDTEVRLALTEAGLELRELTRAYSPAGYPSIILYQIEQAAK